MKKITLSNTRILFYLLADILLISLFIFITIVFVALLLRQSEVSLLLVVATIAILLVLFFLFVIYPIVFFVVMYDRDKHTSLHFDKTTGAASFRYNNKQIDFNLSDIVEVVTSIGFFRSAIVDYDTICLSSGEKIIITCLLPIRELLQNKKIKKKCRMVFWITELIR